ncbi:M61 family metallopeptidase [Piscinibacter sakaiensis]|nr:hypothetical protein [Piscinibacter sakaiensis]
MPAVLVAAAAGPSAAAAPAATPSTVAAQAPAADVPHAGEPGCVLAFEVTPRYDGARRSFLLSLSFPAQGRRETTMRLSNGWAGVTDFPAAFGAWQATDPGVRVVPLDAEGGAGEPASPAVRPAAAAAPSSASAGTAVPPGPAPSRWRIEHPAEGRVRLQARVESALDDGRGPTPEGDRAMYRAQVGPDSFQFFGYALLPGLAPWDDRARTTTCVTLSDPAHPPALLFGSHGQGRGRVTLRIEGSPALARHAFYAGGPGWRVLERPLPGGPLFTALRGRYAAPDEAYADAAAAIVGTHRRFWGSEGSGPQWLVLTPNFSPRNRGGTLVQAAAVLHVDRDFAPASGGLDFLVGHENLHQWFSQRFGGREPAGRPGQGAADAWFSEGFTDYYTHRLLLASGQWNLARYAGELTNALRRWWRSPARGLGSAALLPRFFADADAGAQFYRRGELLAMRWDRALRQGGGPGLDDALRGLMLPAAADPRDPPASGRVLDGLARWLGALPRRDLQAYLVDGRPLPLEPDLAGPCFLLAMEELPRWTAGFDTAASFQARRVQGVVPGGPAAAAGLRDGQALLGWSVYGGDTSRDIELTLPGVDGGPARPLRYRPVDGRTERLPTLRVRDGAETSADCRAWQRRERF